METTATCHKDPKEYISSISNQLKTQGFSKIPSSLSMQAWPFFNSKDWKAFSATWNNLLLDEYMGDGGKYRYRRFSQFHLDGKTGNLHLEAHSSYKQPSYINSLNGDIERYYEPLDQQQQESQFLLSYLRWLGDIFTDASGHDQYLINLHPYRIKASPADTGKPTPEGLHRDGVDFVTSLMIGRTNIQGGISMVADNQRTTLDEWEMQDPGDLLICQDDKVLHSVSELTPATNERPASRDVLVVAFEKILL